ncbi:MAG: SCO family protein [Bacteroidota bacterium]
MNSKRVKQLLIVFAILILPCIFWLVLIRGKNNYIPIEIFGPKEVAATTTNGIPDTIYHTVGDFSLTDQFGRTVTNKTFDGKTYVADFFFATCQTICPKMTSELNFVQDKFQDDNDVVIISHTVNPEHDSVSVLYDYSNKYKALKDKWYFVTGDKKQIYDLARNSYFITAMPGNGGANDFIHSEKIVLIDHDKRIRGYYDGTDHGDMERLIDEIQVLKLEYKDKKK